MIGSGLWIWDDVIDPAGAVQTVRFRLVYLIFLLLPWLFKHTDDLRRLTLFSIGIILFTEALFVHILTYLKMGMVYGIGGFMYYMLIPPLALQPFSLKSSLLYIVLAALLPHIMALTGMAPGFEHLHYAVLIWPAAALAMLIQYFYALEYRQRYNLKKRLETLSYTDTLSGLYNRRYFMQFMQKELKRFERHGKPFSFLMIDIDHFKKINDTFGHPVGDTVIQAVSALLRREIREMDFAARIGGEEFAVVLPETGNMMALDVADRIRRTAENFKLSTPTHEAVRFKLSIGIASAKRGYDISDLMRAADTALYEAKKRGRNRVCFFTGDTVSPVSELG
ncbi:GGDEF domain-containing protein [Hydrogenimonas sp. SS33]|uniref:GGDEF domain-containing protein n=1 Tax=Hydrogenimonas leucolamina TaxID=2954236 RepID=UPI00336C05B8